MLGSTIVGTWHIEGQHPSLRLTFGRDQTWWLTNSAGLNMSGVWRAADTTLDLKIQRYGQLTVRKVAKATGALIIGMAKGLASVAAAIIVPRAEDAMAPAFSQGEPPVLGTFTQDQVRKGEANARFVLMAGATNEIHLRNARNTKTHHRIIKLNRVA